MNCNNVDVIKKAILELVSRVWEERVFSRAQVPSALPEKLIPKPKGLLPASLSLAVQPGRGWTLVASLSLGSRIPRPVLACSRLLLGFNGN